MSKRLPSVRSDVSGYVREPWNIHFFQRDDESIPGFDFLDACPDRVRAKFLAILEAVADAPPPSFSGGGYWEAMHGEMTGFYEVRVDGKNRHHYRLFCILARDGEKVGLGGPSIVVLIGLSKKFRTTLRDEDYQKVHEARDGLTRDAKSWSVAD